ncbi:enoyl-CoA hydratase-related protein [Saccharopolyspora indica]|uniref:enoyl-CoA hydratase/isomerase family protein n=1 Tax=Saccharopolyspora indica TaxID=1229659 RepID=UPI0022EA4F30|nr:enoyl-CoA hydratase-related protein [Saccharopolyspora indica]MDA3648112.1 enoyl-CoA hydratase-related protein [Saccharopolyspora indica]
MDSRKNSLRASVADGVARIVLNRPEKRNGLDRELGERLLESVLRAARDTEVRAIVITGAGPAFCAGDDIARLQEILRGERENAASFRESGDAHYLRICEAVIRAPKPVIAGINGAAIGAGAEIACAADYRIAARSACIGSCVANLGHVGNAVLLPRVVGLARATEIFMTGRLVGSAEAERIGLFDRVVDDAEFHRELDELARTTARSATKSLGLFKELRERAWAAPVAHGLRLQDEYHDRCCNEVEDASEGPRAFLERRDAKFTGR